MKDKLRELAGDWRVAADAHDEIGFGAASDVGRTCADELLALIDAEGDGGAVGEAHQAVCPITKRPFFMDIEHPTIGVVATYGGPFDSYTIPEPDEDGCFRSERYDHDAGDWMEGGNPEPLMLVHDDEYNDLYDRANNTHPARSGGAAVPEIFPGTRLSLSKLSIQPKGQAAMVISEEQRSSMLEAAKPLIQWMNENCNPHCAARVDQNTIELTKGVTTNRTDEFLRD